MTEQVSTQLNFSVFVTIMKCKFALCILMIMAALGAKAQSQPLAALIITNAAVYTADKQRPKADAEGVIGDRIVALTSRSEIAEWGGVKPKGSGDVEVLVRRGF